MSDASVEPFGLEGEASVEDPRVRDLLEGYVACSGATLQNLAPNLQQLTVPAADRTAFGRRSAIRLAFSADALADDENAELAIVGSAFVNQLIAAVRRRGARLMMGRVLSADGHSAVNPPPPVPVSNGRAGTPTTRMVRHRVGRLTARVVVRAGADAKERLAESDLFDLCTGVALGSDVANACIAAGAPAGDENKRAEWDALPIPGIRPVEELVRLMLGSLERRIRPEIDALDATAQRALEHELGRIERYYKALEEDLGGRGSQVVDAASRATFRAEHQRRAREETERHRVRATVHPVQLAEWEVVVQRAEWPIESATGHNGVFTAQRVLAGDQQWVALCPTCSIAPAALTVCRQDHVACPNCAQRCFVCGDAFCKDHGIAGCHVDNAPACSVHSRTCPSCRRSHCTQHEGVCDETDHLACTACLAPCAHCQRMVCNEHATISHPDAPRGARRLCSNCVRACEGGTGEVVGPDEVVGCASCSRVVCERHQARCAVDGLVHCSKHLRRADRSGRLVCEQHRAACIHEPNAVLATDEVTTCATCRGSTCGTHSAECVADRTVHCTTHLVPVRDIPGGFTCQAHRTVCHIDGGVFSPTGTTECPSCARLHCATHRRKCQNCGRGVCTNDFRPATNQTCGTCGRLADVEDLSDAVLSSVAAARRGNETKVKRWRSARDARHVVVELDLGWTRRLVMAIPHGGGRAESVVSHSLFGSKNSSGT